MAEPSSPPPQPFPSLANTPMEPVDEQSPAIIEGPPAKKKNRQRLLRGIQRISSSPSLAPLGRPRAHSSPYKTKTSLSCVSLAHSSLTPSTSAGSGTLHSGDSYFPSGAYGLSYASQSSSQAGTPATEPGESDEIVNARLAASGLSTPQSIGLPCDIRPTSKPQITNPAVPIKGFHFWESLPDEMKVMIFSLMSPRELVRVSRVSRTFHEICFDGQLWTRLDASEFYQDIPAESLAKIIQKAGPFIQDLNLRGCVQVEQYERADVIAKACTNLYNASLEGCRNFEMKTLHGMLRANPNLTNLNLTGLQAVTNITCKIIAESCPQLRHLNLSWCVNMDARGVKAVVKACPQLKDLRARAIRGFDNIDVAEVIFRTNNLERLVLSGCVELSDRALKIMVHGEDPERDILSDIPLVSARKWRHLDLTRCTGLTSSGVQALGNLTPDLEGLQLSGCTTLDDAALEPILATTPRLTHLELEDLAELTNSLLTEHLAKAPCAPVLEHLSLSYCENLGDQGVLPVIKNCVSLRSVDLDNTRISDLVLAEASQMVSRRSKRTTEFRSRPNAGLHMVIYDCQNVTWTGVREILFRNAHQTKQSLSATSPDAKHGSYTWSYPTEVISLKCFYGFQMTVDEHMKRVLRGDFASASRLESRWADYMQANEEAGAHGAGHRRRRRRAREAAMLHATEEEGAPGSGRRRARTMGACAVM